MDTPVWSWEPWLQDMHAAGYLAAMNHQPFNPFAMKEWQMGFLLYLENHVSQPIRKQMRVS
jgi:hypothetical protein